MGDRCRGDCCRSMYLPVSPERLRNSYNAWMAQEKTDVQGLPILTDIHLLGTMLVHLGELEANPLTGHPSGSSKAHYYRCKHLAENGDCTIYDIRPKMCRDYPYGYPCQYPGCECDDARSGVMGRVSLPILDGDKDKSAP